MKELWIPELLSSFFLLFFLWQPAIKGLRYQKGILWFPFIALLIVIGIFPAYGFRPECIPLLTFVLVFNIINFPSFFKNLSHSVSYTLHNGGILYIWINFFVLVLVTGFSLFFIPLKDTVLSSDGIKSIRLEDTARNIEYFLRIYGPSASDQGVQARGERPLLIFIPPVLGSVTAVDLICTELRERGFVVLTYSRSGLDSPALSDDGRRLSLSPVKNWELYQIYRSGTATVKANVQGRILEQERLRDIDFLLSWIRQAPVLDDGLPALPNADPDRVFLYGYGAGGSALALIAASPGFSLSNPQVKGIIVTESLLWSCFAAQEQAFKELPPKAGIIQKTWNDIENWFISLSPPRIGSVKTVPHPTLPLLIMLSDLAMDDSRNDMRYTAILKLFEETKNPRVLTIIPGAGRLDYTDYPVKYPLYSALSPGKYGNFLQKIELTSKNAALITNFAAGLIAAEQKTDNQYYPVLRTEKIEGIHIETKAWNFSVYGYIVNP
jgi:hypothetical protein